MQDVMCEMHYSVLCTGALWTKLARRVTQHGADTTYRSQQNIHTMCADTCVQAALFGGKKSVHVTHEIQREREKMISKSFALKAIVYVVYVRVLCTDAAHSLKPTTTIPSVWLLDETRAENVA